MSSVAADHAIRWRRLYNAEELEAYGIYSIETPVEDFQLYIGSTKVSFEKRWTQHLTDLDGGRHANRHLQRLYNAHGADWLSFHVVEFITDPKRVRERELFWIKNQTESEGRERMLNIAEMEPQWTQTSFPFVCELLVASPG